MLLTKCIEYFLLETCVSKRQLDTPLQGQRQALGINVYAGGQIDEPDAPALH